MERSICQGSLEILMGEIHNQFIDLQGLGLMWIRDQRIVYRLVLKIIENLGEKMTGTINRSTMTASIIVILWAHR